VLVSNSHKIAEFVLDCYEIASSLCKLQCRFMSMLYADRQAEIRIDKGLVGFYNIANSLTDTDDQLLCDEDFNY
jgi:hypothetical protein